MSVPLYPAKAEFFKTLGHPARVRILELLCERDRSVRELLASIDIEPSNLSQQLSILRRGSLVTSQRRDGEVCYSVSAPGVGELLLLARTILSRLARVDHEVDDLAPTSRRAAPRLQDQERRG